MIISLKTFNRLAVFYLCIERVISAAACYNLDGSLQKDLSFQPCDPNAAVSACCATAKPQGDICMQGGLCYGTQNSYNGYIYGNGCTDSTGDDPACPNACSAKSNGWASYNVLQCSRGTWCCREATNTTNCCGDRSALISGDVTSYIGRFPSTATSNEPNTTSANTTTVSTETTTVTASATSSTSSSSSNEVVVVGAAVGASLGIAFIIALAGLLFMLRKAKALKKEIQSLKQGVNTEMKSDQTYYRPTELGTTPTVQAHEADWGNGRYEMDGAK